VAVSPRAVRQGVDGPFVYRVRDGKAELVRVEVGYADEGVTVLTRGLGPGETVVVDGHSRLKHGAAVAVVGEPKRPGPLAGAGR
jgi:membrane fusion protein, multidrug efflux system